MKPVDYQACRSTHFEILAQALLLTAHEAPSSQGFGSVEGVSLVGFRGFLQSLFATKEAVAGGLVLTALPLQPI